MFGDFGVFVLLHGFFCFFVYIIGMFLCIFFDVFILRWVSEN